MEGLGQFVSTQYKRLVCWGDSIYGYYNPVYRYVRRHIISKWLFHKINLYSAACNLWCGLQYKARSTMIRLYQRVSHITSFIYLHNGNSRYIAGATLTAVLMLVFASGYYVALATVEYRHLDDMYSEIQSYSKELSDIYKIREEEETLLLKRVALSQAQVTKMEALGQYMVRQYGLSDSEFDFLHGAGTGGMTGQEGPEIKHLEQIQLSEMNEQLEKRIYETQVKLDVMAQFLAKHNSNRNKRPSGLPVSHAWISSRFAYRISPFTGRREFHRGIDMAGREGSPIKAIASGIVERVGHYGAYGNLVEIKHPGGYSTLYAHNQAILVNKGDMVKKGQAIALLGNTGRSTGPHLHFEVIKDGKRINPRPYILGSRK